MSKVISVNVSSFDRFISLGEDASKLIGLTVGACVFARGATKERADTPEERRARIAALKKKGPLPAFRGWDAESHDEYMTDCERAAAKSLPAEWPAVRRVYCECTHGAVTVQFRDRTEGEAAIRRFTSKKSPTGETWVLSTYWGACSYFAPRM